MSNLDIQPIVCLDPGHYKKYNMCPNNPRYYESEIVWKLTMLQKKYLEMLGVKVILTREDTDKDLALNLRGAKAAGCDLFISNHTNAVGNIMNELIDYVAAYHLVDDATTDVDDISKKYAEALAPIIADVMGTQQGFRVLTRKSGNDRNKDGILNDNYYAVLHAARQVNCPALILEHSFHTNTRTVEWLLNDNNLDKLAKAEAECVASLLFGREIKFEDLVHEDVFHRVQIGAYGVKENAYKALLDVKRITNDAFVTMVDGLYKIQVGAYKVKANAEVRVQEMVKAGYKDAFITTKCGAAVEIKLTKTNEEIAKEVINGKWGNGNTREQKLEAAGYDYDVIQVIVNKMLK